MLNNHNKTKKQDIASDQVDIAQMQKQIKKLTLRLWAGIFAVFIIIAVGVLMFTSVYYEQIAQALTGNYGKATGDLLTASDWNNLDNDFVAKSGDAMTGSLTVNGTVSANAVSTSGNITLGGEFRKNNHPVIKCDFDGTWVYNDAGGGNDFAISCRDGVITGWCGDANSKGLPRGLNAGSYDCE